MASRSSGVLLHVTSLPGPYGIGDLGPSAYRFADLLARAGQRLWQVLPLVPTITSPYSSLSSFAGNPLLVSPERLLEDGLLTEDDLADAPDFPTDRVDFDAVIAFKGAVLDRAYERFSSGGHQLRGEFRNFCRQHADWLEDYALFMALRDAHAGAVWTEWPTPLRRRDEPALDAARRRHAATVERYRFRQFLFDHQWSALRSYCHDHGVRLFGDIPIYVAHDSADVWASPDMFHLDSEGRPTVVSGVPPDYFSETGQRWGNPLYRWDQMQADGYRWWKSRLSRTLDEVDIVRLDHFRGFEAYWEIPAEEETAVNGQWVDGPSDALFSAFEAALGIPLPIVAEDLGTITPSVRQLMQQFGLPGMAVLQFAFSTDASNEYLPHQYRRKLVAYTGTHDNNTFVGWWTDDASDEERRFAAFYLGLDHSTEPPHWAAVRAVLGSVADMAIIPFQDVVGLGSEARMNTPGEGDDNWAWRATDADLAAFDPRLLRDLTETYGRLLDEDAEPEDQTEDQAPRDAEPISK
jgi:4-alpha-glucanotransferase